LADNFFWGFIRVELESSHEVSVVQ
jgi:hypothetical protein